MSTIEERVKKIIGEQLGVKQEEVTNNASFVEDLGEHLYEVGPGKVLTGLTKRIVDTLTASALNEPSAMAAALEL